MLLTHPLAPAGQQDDPEPCGGNVEMPIYHEAVVGAYLPVLLAFAQDQVVARESRPPRVHPPRIRHAPENPYACVSAYRLDPPGVQELCELLGPQLQNQVDSERCIPVIQRVLMCLHFLGTGSFEGDVARQHRTSQSSASRCVAAVVDALIEHVHEYIVFPLTEEQRSVTRDHFYAIAGFPNVIACVDGSHIPIAKPSNAGVEFVNRHRQMSLNVMATSNAQCYFTSAMTECPGSFHDARVFRQSSLQEVASSWPEGTGWLLGMGDRGYPLRTYLLTPYPADTPGPIARYNAAHRKTRIVIERAFGMLKLRFRCLHASGGRLMRDPEKAAKIIMACMMLHNLCLRRKIPLLDESGGPPEPIPVLGNEDEQGRHHPGPDHRAAALREYVTRTYFGHEPVVSHIQWGVLGKGRCGEPPCAVALTHQPLVPCRSEGLLHAPGGQPQHVLVADNCTPHPLP